MRDLALAAVLGLALPAAALAQGGPAELPPADFEGRQYVDSAGCVFVRVEVNGAVDWAPRLNRDRTPLCGYRPSKASGVAAAEGALPEIVPDAPPVIADAATVTETPAEAVVVPASVTRPGVPRRTDVYAGKYSGASSVPARRLPPGYKAVWDDDRLNPNRGPRTAEGDAQMRRIWSDTVPMEYIGPGS